MTDFSPSPATKPAVQSTTIVAAIGAIGAGIAAVAHAWQVQDLSTGATGVVSIIGGVAAIYGRLRATTAISGLFRSDR